MKALIGEAQDLKGEIEVPGGNMIVAAPWVIAAATAHHDANVTIRSVNLDPAHTGFIDALQRMGARLELQKRREVDGRPVADVWVRSSWLRGAQIDSETAARMVDEFPLFAVAAAVTDGSTIVRLPRSERDKQAELFAATKKMLDQMEIYFEEADEGLLIEGDEHFHGGEYDAAGDPRMALALGVAGLIAAETIAVNNAECVESLYPGFWDELKRHTGGEVVFR